MNREALPKPVLTDLAWKSRLQDYANGLFKFGTGQPPPKASKWHRELEKIDKCPRKMSPSVVKDLFGHAIKCTCGYHTSGESQPQSQILRLSTPEPQQVVAPETAHHWPSDTRVSAASCLSDISPVISVPSPASTASVIASEQVGLSPVACSSEQLSSEPAEAVSECTPSVTRSFTLVNTQTSSGTVTCASTVTPTSEPLRKVRVILKL